MQTLTKVPSLKVRFGGSLGSEGEQWCCGFHMEDMQGRPGSDAAKAFIGDVSTAVQAYFGRAQSQFHGSARLEYTKIYAVDVKGVMQQLDGPAEALYSGGISSANNGQLTGPLTLSMVVTLDSLIRAKNGRFGRWYVPTGVQTCMTDTGRFDPARVTLAVGSVQTFINDINGNGSTGGRMVLPFNTPDGTSQAVIKQFRIGDVPGQMRSRRKQLTEHYHVQTL